MAANMQSRELVLILVLGRILVIHSVHPADRDVFFIRTTIDQWPNLAPMYDPEFMLFGDLPDDWNVVFPETPSFIVVTKHDEPEKVPNVAEALP